jgi:hypothetical protein
MAQINDVKLLHAIWPMRSSQPRKKPKQARQAQNKSRKNAEENNADRGSLPHIDEYT